MGHKLAVPLRWPITVTKLSLLDTPVFRIDSQKQVRFWGQQRLSWSVMYFTTHTALNVCAALLRLTAQLHYKLITVQWEVEWYSKISIVSQLTGRLNAIKKLKSADFKSKLSITTALIQSKIQYLLPLYGGAPDYLMNAVQVQQLKAARFVCGYQR